MTFDPTQQLRRSSETYRALIASAGDRHDDVVLRLRSDQCLPRLLSDWYLEDTGRLNTIRYLEHEPFTYVYDAPSLSKLPGDDRVVAALGISQPRRRLSEIVALIMSAIDDNHCVPGDLIELFKNTLIAHDDAIPIARRESLHRAMNEALNLFVGGPRNHPHQRLAIALRRPSASLLSALMHSLLPALGDTYPPRSNRARSQYRKIRGMQGLDVGHFIAHSMGGLPDINMFPQDRKLNRGWSVAGGKYRHMERFLAARPGTFFFHRPIYVDPSWTPRYLELCVLVETASIGNLPIVDSEHMTIGHICLLGDHPHFRLWSGAFENA